MGSVTPIDRRKAVPQQVPAKRSGVAFEPPPEPEEALRQLFRKEAQLEAELRDVRFRVSLVRRIYATKHGLLMLPGIEQLRRMFSL